MWRLKPEESWSLVMSTKYFFHTQGYDDFSYIVVYMLCVVYFRWRTIVHPSPLWKGCGCCLELPSEKWTLYLFDTQDILQFAFKHDVLHSSLQSQNVKTYLAIVSAWPRYSFWMNVGWYLIAKQVQNRQSKWWILRTIPVETGSSNIVDCITNRSFGMEGTMVVVVSLDQ